MSSSSRMIIFLPPLKTMREATLYSIGRRPAAPALQRLKFPVGRIAAALVAVLAGFSVYRFPWSVRCPHPGSSSICISNVDFYFIPFSYSCFNFYLISSLFVCVTPARVPQLRGCRARVPQLRGCRCRCDFEVVGEIIPSSATACLMVVTTMAGHCLRLLHSPSSATLMTWSFQPLQQRRRLLQSRYTLPQPPPL
jgi:hypothetical protein